LTIAAEYQQPAGPDLTAAVILRQRIAELLSAVFREPGDIGFQLDRNLALEIARRAIILCQSSTQKKPGHRGRAF
jgi:hypothetical protein